MVHLPAGYPRTLRCNDGALSHLAYRCLPVLLSGDLTPTARAVAERFGCNKDTACKALRSLETCGYLRRWRVSAGRNTWLHFAVVTDESYDWELDPRLEARITEWQERTFSAFLDRHHLAAEEAAPAVPSPAARPAPAAPETSASEQVFAPSASEQVSSCPGSSDPTDSDIPRKNPSLGSSPPKPPKRAQVIHRRQRRDPVERAVRRCLSQHPELEPHLPNALATLEGLRFPPRDRVKGARVLAMALARGYSLSWLISWLTERLSSARSRQVVQKWRVDRLAVALGIPPAYTRVAT